MESHVYLRVENGKSRLQMKNVEYIADIAHSRCDNCYKVNNYVFQIKIDVICLTLYFISRICFNEKKYYYYILQQFYFHFLSLYLSRNIILVKYFPDYIHYFQLRNEIWACNKNHSMHFIAFSLQKMVELKTVLSISNVQYLHITHFKCVLCAKLAKRIIKWATKVPLIHIICMQKTVRKRICKWIEEDGKK